jgi:hypothetical protein
MFTLTHVRKFGDVLTNVRDTTLSIFVPKEPRASNTENLSVVVRPCLQLTVTKCTGMPTDKNDDCVLNEFKHLTFDEIIEMIRYGKKLGFFHR